MQRRAALLSFSRRGPLELQTVHNKQLRNDCDTARGRTPLPSLHCSPLPFSVARLEVARPLNAAKDLGRSKLPAGSGAKPTDKRFGAYSSYKEQPWLQKFSANFPKNKCINFCLTASMMCNSADNDISAITDLFIPRVRVVLVIANVYILLLIQTLKAINISIILGLLLFHPLLQDESLNSQCSQLRNLTSRNSLVHDHSIER